MFVAGWRWRLFAGVFAVTLALCGGFLVWPIAAGYTEAPVLRKSSAWRALEDARRAAAERWAPDFQRAFSACPARPAAAEWAAPAALAGPSTARLPPGKRS
jgi:hypothetical protein